MNVGIHAAGMSYAQSGPEGGGGLGAGLVYCRVVQLFCGPHVTLHSDACRHILKCCRRASVVEERGVGDCEEVRRTCDGCG